MSQDHPIPDNVRAFLSEAAEIYGRHKEEEFSQFMWSLCCDTESPIEQLFVVALNLVSEVNLVSVAVGGGFGQPYDGLVVVPQWRVDKYRVDFALRFGLYEEPKTVCVELDGHEFHDRDERQRRYEKARDRFLTAKGYSALHYTGSEVVKDACAVALEAFVLATGMGDIAVHPRDLYP